MVAEQMNVGLYARVSSEKQDVDLSISGQLNALRKYAAEQGHVIAKEYVEEAESGRSSNRPVFQRMISDARRTPSFFQGILVWKLSRFARSREDSVVYKSLLRKHGVQVISISERFDDGPAGKMLEGMIELVDEFYSSSLAQDVVRGMREATSRGYWVMSNTPIGYRRVKVSDGGRQRTKLDENPSTSWIVRRIFERALAGGGMKEIASSLNAEGIPSPTGKRWGKQVVHDILTNELYTGLLVFGANGRFHKEAGLEAVRVPDAFPALVKHDEFERVQQMLHSRAPQNLSPRRAASRYLLSGLLHCGACGAAMFGVAAKSGRYHYYTCATAYRLGRDACAMKSVRVDRLDRLVVESIRELVLRREHVDELVRLTNEELSLSIEHVKARVGGLRKRETELSARLMRLFDALETGKLDLEDLSPRIKELRQQQELLLRAIVESEEAARASKVQLVDRDQVLGYVGELQSVLASGSINEQKALLKSFVRKVEKHENRAVVHYAIPVPAEEHVLKPGPVLDTVVSGGAGGTRTLGLFNAIEVLSQLSYSPTSVCLQAGGGPGTAREVPPPGTPTT